jgi:hypothetical protein
MKPLGSGRLAWWRKWTVRLTLVACVAVACYFYVLYQADARLREVITRLDGDDPGWRLDEIEAARPQIPPGENSALVVIATRDLMADNWPPAEFGNAFADLTANSPLSDEEYGRLCNEMNEWGEALAAARKLTDMPRGRYRIVYTRPNLYLTRLGNEQKAREAAHLLRYAALRRAEEGDADGALADCRAIVNSGRSIGDEPLMISQLIRHACVSSGCVTAERVLARGTPSPVALEALQKLLEDDDAFPDQWHGARGERACVHEMVGALQSGAVAFNQVSGGAPVPAQRLILPFVNPLFKYEHPRMLSLMTRIVDASKMPARQQLEVEAAIEAEFRVMPQTAVLSRLLIPAVNKVSEASRRKHAYLRCVIAGLAAERYRRAHGAWPESLTDLVPEQLSAVPLDPFDDQPLRYLRLPGGIEIYSVGPDLKDDNGNLGTPGQQQRTPGFDLGIRMWDPEERGR